MAPVTSACRCSIKRRGLLRMKGGDPALEPGLWDRDDAVRRRRSPFASRWRGCSPRVGDPRARVEATARLVALVRLGVYPMVGRGRARQRCHSPAHSRTDQRAVAGSDLNRETSRETSISPRQVVHAVGRPLNVIFASRRAFRKWGPFVGRDRETCLRGRMDLWHSTVSVEQRLVLPRAARFGESFGGAGTPPRPLRLPLPLRSPGTTLAMRWPPYLSPMKRVSRERR